MPHMHALYHLLPNLIYEGRILYSLFLLFIGEVLVILALLPLSPLSCTLDLSLHNTQ